MKYMRLLFCALFTAATPGFAGATLSCVGSRVLLVETQRDSGIAVPGKSGALYLEDRLIERRWGRPGDTGVKWQQISVERNEPVLELASRSTHNLWLRVSKENLTVERLDGKPLLEDGTTKFSEPVLCTHVWEARPIP